MRRVSVCDALAERFHLGNRAALAEIARSLGPPISRALERKYGGLLPDGEAQSIVNSAIAHAWRQHAEYLPAKGPLGGWLWAIVKHFVADFLRSPSMRARRLEIATAHEALATLLDPKADDPAHYDGSPGRSEELPELVRQALATLSAHERYVLLADAASPEGQVPSSRLALELGVTASAIRNCRARGKKRLEAELRRLGVEKCLFPCDTPDVSNHRGQYGERRTENGEVL